MTHSIPPVTPAPQPPITRTTTTRTGPTSPTNMPPAGRASGPTTRSWPPAAGATRPGPSATPGCPARSAPAAHRRQPDRVDLVQVVRPAGRSTWTRSTRPGRAKPARREAHLAQWPAGPATTSTIFGSTWGANTARATVRYQRSPTPTSTTTSTHRRTPTTNADLDLVRDEGRCERSRTMLAMRVQPGRTMPARGERRCRSTR